MARLLVAAFLASLFCCLCIRPVHCLYAFPYPTPQFVFERGGRIGAMGTGDYYGFVANDGWIRPTISELNQQYAPVKFPSRGIRGQPGYYVDDAFGAFTIDDNFVLQGPEQTGDGFLTDMGNPGWLKQCTLELIANRHMHHGDYVPRYQNETNVGVTVRTLYRKRVAYRDAHDDFTFSPIHERTRSEGCVFQHAEPPPASATRNFTVTWPYETQPPPTMVSTAGPNADTYGLSPRAWDGNGGYYGPRTLTRPRVTSLLTVGAGTTQATTIFDQRHRIMPADQFLSNRSAYIEIADFGETAYGEIHPAVFDYNYACLVARTQPKGYHTSIGPCYYDNSHTGYKAGVRLIARVFYHAGERYSTLQDYIPYVDQWHPRMQKWVTCTATFDYVPCTPQLDETGYPTGAMPPWPFPVQYTPPANNPPGLFSIIPQGPADATVVASCQITYMYLYQGSRPFTWLTAESLGTCTGTTVETAFSPRLWAEVVARRYAPDAKLNHATKQWLAGNVQAAVCAAVHWDRRSVYDTFANRTWGIGNDRSSFTDAIAQTLVAPYPIESDRTPEGGFISRTAAWNARTAPFGDPVNGFTTTACGGLPEFPHLNRGQLHGFVRPYFRVAPTSGAPPIVLAQQQVPANWTRALTGDATSAVLREALCGTAATNANRTHTGPTVCAGRGLGCPGHETCYRDTAFFAQTDNDPQLGGPRDGYCTVVREIIQTNSSTNSTCACTDLEIEPFECCTLSACRPLPDGPTCGISGPPPIGERVCEGNLTLIASRGCTCTALGTKVDCELPYCPIDCELGEAYAVSDCSGSCGLGHTKIMRRDVVVPAQHGGACPVANNESVYFNATCNAELPPCPEPCVLSEWADTTNCYPQCVGPPSALGTYERRTKIQTRSVVKPGTPCGELSRVVDCVTGPADQCGAGFPQETSAVFRFCLSGEAPVRMSNNLYSCYMRCPTVSANDPAQWSLAFPCRRGCSDAQLDVCEDGGEFHECMEAFDVERVTSVGFRTFTNRTVCVRERVSACNSTDLEEACPGEPTAAYGACFRTDYANGTYSISVECMADRAVALRDLYPSPTYSVSFCSNEQLRHGCYRDAGRCHVITIPSLDQAFLVFDCPWADNVVFNPNFDVRRNVPANFFLAPYDGTCTVAESRAHCGTSWDFYPHRKLCTKRLAAYNEWAFSIETTTSGDCATPFCEARERLDRCGTGTGYATFCLATVQGPCTIGSTRCAAFCQSNLVTARPSRPCTFEELQQHSACGDPFRCRVVCDDNFTFRRNCVVETWCTGGAQGAPTALSAGLALDFVGNTGWNVQGARTDWVRACTREETLRLCRPYIHPADPRWFHVRCILVGNPNTDVWTLAPEGQNNCPTEAEETWAVGARFAFGASQPGQPVASEPGWTAGLFVANQTHQWCWPNLTAVYHQFPFTAANGSAPHPALFARRNDRYLFCSTDLNLTTPLANDTAPNDTQIELPYFATKSFVRDGTVDAYPWRRPLVSVVDVWRGDTRFPLHIAELRVHVPGVGFIAPDDWDFVTMSGEYQDFFATNAFDSDPGTFMHTSAAPNGFNETFLRFELPQPYAVDYVEVLNRDNYCERLAGFYIRVFSADGAIIRQSTPLTGACGTQRLLTHLDLCATGVCSEEGESPPLTDEQYATLIEAQPDGAATSVCTSTEWLGYPPNGFSSWELVDEPPHVTCATMRSHCRVVRRAGNATKQELCPAVHGWEWVDTEPLRADDDARAARGYCPRDTDFELWPLSHDDMDISDIIEYATENSCTVPPLICPTSAIAAFATCPIRDRNACKVMWDGSAYSVYQLCPGTTYFEKVSEGTRRIAGFPAIRLADGRDPNIYRCTRNQSHELCPAGWQNNSRWTDCSLTNCTINGTNRESCALIAGSCYSRACTPSESLHLCGYYTHQCLVGCAPGAPLSECALLPLPAGVAKLSPSGPNCGAASVRPARPCTQEEWNETCADSVYDCRVHCENAHLNTSCVRDFACPSRRAGDTSYGSSVRFPANFVGTIDETIATCGPEWGDASAQPCVIRECNYTHAQGRAICVCDKSSCVCPGAFELNGTRCATRTYFTTCSNSTALSTTRQLCGQFSADCAMTCVGSGYSGTCNATECVCADNARPWGGLPCEGYRVPCNASERIRCGPEALECYRVTSPTSRLPNPDALPSQGISGGESLYLSSRSLHPRDYFECRCASGPGESFVTTNQSCAIVAGALRNCTTEEVVETCGPGGLSCSVFESDNETAEVLHATCRCNSTIQTFLDEDGLPYCANATYERVCTAEERATFSCNSPNATLNCTLLCTADTGQCRPVNDSCYVTERRRFQCGFDHAMHYCGRGLLDVPATREAFERTRLLPDGACTMIASYVPWRGFFDVNASSIECNCPSTRRLPPLTGEVLHWRNDYGKLCTNPSNAQRPCTPDETTRLCFQSSVYRLFGGSAVSPYLQLSAEEALQLRTQDRCVVNAATGDLVPGTCPGTYTLRACTETEVFRFCPVAGTVPESQPHCMAACPIDASADALSCQRFGECAKLIPDAPCSLFCPSSLCNETTVLRQQAQHGYKYFGLELTCNYPCRDGEVSGGGACNNWLYETLCFNAAGDGCGPVGSTASCTRSPLPGRPRVCQCNTGRALVQPDYREIRDANGLFTAFEVTRAYGACEGHVRPCTASERVALGGPRTANCTVSCLLGPGETPATASRNCRLINATCQHGFPLSHVATAHLSVLAGNNDEAAAVPRLDLPCGLDYYDIPGFQSINLTRARQTCGQFVALVSARVRVAANGTNISVDPIKSTCTCLPGYFAGPNFPCERDFYERKCTAIEATTLVPQQLAALRTCVYDPLRDCTLQCRPSAQSPSGEYCFAFAPHFCLDRNLTEVACTEALAVEKCGPLYSACRATCAFSSAMANPSPVRVDAMRQTCQSAPVTCACAAVGREVFPDSLGRPCGRDYTVVPCSVSDFGAEAKALCGDRGRTCSKRCRFSNGTSCFAADSCTCEGNTGALPLGRAVDGWELFFSCIVSEGNSDSCAPYEHGCGAYTANVRYSCIGEQSDPLSCNRYCECLPDTGEMYAGIPCSGYRRPCEPLEALAYCKATSSLSATCSLLCDRTAGGGEACRLVQGTCSYATAGGNMVSSRPCTEQERLASCGPGASSCTAQDAVSINPVTGIANVSTSVRTETCQCNAQVSMRQIFNPDTGQLTYPGLTCVAPTGMLENCTTDEAALCGLGSRGCVIRRVFASQRLSQVQVDIGWLLQGNAFASYPPLLRSDSWGTFQMRFRECQCAADIYNSSSHTVSVSELSPFPYRSTWTGDDGVMRCDARHRNAYSEKGMCPMSPLGQPCYGRGECGGRNATTATMRTAIDARFASMPGVTAEEAARYLRITGHALSPFPSSDLPRLLGHRRSGHASGDFVCVRRVQNQLEQPVAVGDLLRQETCFIVPGHAARRNMTQLLPRSGVDYRAQLRVEDPTDGLLAAAYDLYLPPTFANFTGYDYIVEGAPPGSSHAVIMEGLRNSVGQHPFQRGLTAEDVMLRCTARTFPPPPAGTVNVVECRADANASYPASERNVRYACRLTHFVAGGKWRHLDRQNATFYLPNEKGIPKPQETAMFESTWSFASQSVIDSTPPSTDGQTHPMFCYKRTPVARYARQRSVAIATETPLSTSTHTCSVRNITNSTRTTPVQRADGRYGPRRYRGSLKCTRRSMAAADGTGRWTGCSAPGSARIGTTRCSDECTKMLIGNTYAPVWIANTSATTHIYFFARDDNLIFISDSPPGRVPSCTSGNCREWTASDACFESYPGLARDSALTRFVTNALHRGMTLENVAQVIKNGSVPYLFSKTCPLNASISASSGDRLAYQRALFSMPIIGDPACTASSCANPDTRGVYDAPRMPRIFGMNPDNRAEFDGSFFQDIGEIIGDQHNIAAPFSAPRVFLEYNRTDRACEGTGCDPNEGVLHWSNMGVSILRAHYIELTVDGPLASIGKIFIVYKNHTRVRTNQMRRLMYSPDPGIQTPVADRWNSPACFNSTENGCEPHLNISAGYYASFDALECATRWAASRSSQVMWTPFPHFGCTLRGDGTQTPLGLGAGDRNYELPSRNRPFKVHIVVPEPDNILEVVIRWDALAPVGMLGDVSLRLVGNSSVASGDNWLRVLVDGTRTKDIAFEGPGRYGARYLSLPPGRYTRIFPRPGNAADEARIQQKIRARAPRVFELPNAMVYDFSTEPWGTAHSASAADLACVYTDIGHLGPGFGHSRRIPAVLSCGSHTAHAGTSEEILCYYREINATNACNADMDSWVCAPASQLLPRNTTLADTGTPMWAYDCVETNCPADAPGPDHLAFHPGDQLLAGDMRDSLSLVPEISQPNLCTWCAPGFTGDACQLVTTNASVLERHWGIIAMGCSAGQLCETDPATVSARGTPGCANGIWDWRAGRCVCDPGWKLSSIGRCTVTICGTDASPQPCAGTCPTLSSDGTTVTLQPCTGAALRGVCATNSTCSCSPGWTTNGSSTPNCEFPVASLCPVSRPIGSGNTSTPLPCGGPGQGTCNAVSGACTCRSWPNGRFTGAGCNATEYYQSAQCLANGGRVNLTDLAQRDLRGFFCSCPLGRGGENCQFELCPKNSAGVRCSGSGNCSAVSYGPAEFTCKTANGGLAGRLTCSASTLTRDGCACEHDLRTFCTVNGTGPLCGIDGTTLQQLQACERFWDSSLARYSYRCRCPPNRRGRYCELSACDPTDADIAALAALGLQPPAQTCNGHACKRSEFGNSYYCDCGTPLGNGRIHRGKFCSREVTEQCGYVSPLSDIPTTCSGVGTCACNVTSTSVNDSALWPCVTGSYGCQCHAGSTGAFCQFGACVPGDCVHGACTLLDASLSPPSFICECTDPTVWTKSDARGPCTTNACSRGGTVPAAPNSAGTACVCNDPTKSYASNCATSPCPTDAEGYTCGRPYDGDPRLAESPCTDATNKTCDTFGRQCRLGACECSGARGYTRSGQLCAADCVRNNTVSALRTALNNALNCYCKPGFVGARCETQQCFNGGALLAGSIDTCNCTAPLAATPNVTRDARCRPICHNGGVLSGDSSFCLCAGSWSGLDCRIAPSSGGNTTLPPQEGGGPPPPPPAQNVTNGTGGSNSTNPGTGSGGNNGTNVTDPGTGGGGNNGTTNVTDPGTGGGGNNGTTNVTDPGTGSGGNNNTSNGTTPGSGGGGSNNNTNNNTTPVTCQNGGVLSASLTCACQPGWIGVTCGTRACAHLPGTTFDATSGTCKCPAGTSGPGCLTLECVNGGTFVRLADGTGRCDCAAGFAGQFCQNRFCVNGEYFALPGGTFDCLCDRGWSNDAQGLCTARECGGDSTSGNYRNSTTGVCVCTPPRWSLNLQSGETDAERVCALDCGQFGTYVATARGCVCNPTHFGTYCEVNRQALLDDIERGGDPGEDNPPPPGSGGGGGGSTDPPPDPDPPTPPPVCVGGVVTPNGVACPPPPSGGGGGGGGTTDPPDSPFPPPAPPGAPGAIDDSARPESDGESESVVESTAFIASMSTVGGVAVAGGATAFVAWWRGALCFARPGL
jgi:hypothetical protein